MKDSFLRDQTKQKDLNFALLGNIYFFMKKYYDIIETKFKKQT